MAGGCRLVFVDSPTEFYQLRAPQKTVKKRDTWKSKKVPRKRIQGIVPDKEQTNKMMKTPCSVWSRTYAWHHCSQILTQNRLNSVTTTCY